VGPGPHPRRLPAEVAQLQALDRGAARVGADLDQVRLEQHADVGGPLEVRAVGVAEADRVRRLAPEAEGELADVERVDVLADLLPQAAVVAEGPEADERLGAVVVALEVVVGDRPALEPGARGEVDRVERLAPARPVVRGAAEEALPAGLERDVVQAGAALALVERLGGAVEVEPAALDQEDREARPRELPRDRDAGGARADHGDVGLQERAVLELGQAGETRHRSARPGRRCRRAIRGPVHPSRSRRNPESRHLSGRLSTARRKGGPAQGRRGHTARPQI
jgi:hypothetical protein